MTKDSLSGTPRKCVGYARVQPAAEPWDAPPIALLKQGRARPAPTPYPPPGMAGKLARPPCGPNTPTGLGRIRHPPGRGVVSRRAHAREISALRPWEVLRDNDLIGVGSGPPLPLRPAWSTDHARASPAGGAVCPLVESKTFMRTWSRNAAQAQGARGWDDGSDLGCS